MSLGSAEEGRSGNKHRGRMMGYREQTAIHKPQGKAAADLELRFPAPPPAQEKGVSCSVIRNALLQLPNETNTVGSFRAPNLMVFLLHPNSVQHQHIKTETPLWVSLKPHPQLQIMGDDLAPPSFLFMTASRVFPQPLVPSLFSLISN